jgi:hypothetical protein
LIRPATLRASRSKTWMSSPVLPATYSFTVPPAFGPWAGLDGDRASTRRRRAWSLRLQRATGLGPKGLGDAAGRRAVGAEVTQNRLRGPSRRRPAWRCSGHGVCSPHPNGLGRVGVAAVVSARSIGHRARAPVGGGPRSRQARTRRAACPRRPPAAPGRRPEHGQAAGPAGRPGGPPRPRGGPARAVRAASTNLPPGESPPARSPASCCGVSDRSAQCKRAASPVLIVMGLQLQRL